MMRIMQKRMFLKKGDYVISINSDSHTVLDQKNLYCRY